MGFLIVLDDFNLFPLFIGFIVNFLTFVFLSFFSFFYDFVVLNSVSFVELLAQPLRVEHAELSPVCEKTENYLT